MEDLYFIICFSNLRWVSFFYLSKLQISCAVWSTAQSPYLRELAYQSAWSTPTVVHSVYPNPPLGKTTVWSTVLHYYFPVNSNFYFELNFYSGISLLKKLFLWLVITIFSNICTFSSHIKEFEWKSKFILNWNGWGPLALKQRAGQIQISCIDRGPKGLPLWIFC